MNTTKHTPGPWKQESELGIGPQLLVKCNDALVARATSIEDARLIAAAPELLEALQYALNRISFLEGFTEGKADPSNLPMIRAAIAKATNPTL